MRIVFLTLSIIVISYISSCRRENINIPRIQTETLKQTVTRDTLGNITRIVHYNNMALPVRDTGFNRSGQPVGSILYEYNVAGKPIRYELHAPGAYSGGYLWAEDYVYQDDTLMLFKKHFLKGNQTVLTKYFYDAARRPVLDSAFHMGFTITTVIKQSAYDAQGRILSDMTLNTSTDTTIYNTYQYSTNRIEQYKKSFSYNPAMIGYSKTVTDYTPNGNILSEKLYASLTTLVSQTDYLYNGGGLLLKKTTVNTSGTYEERYFYNSNDNRDKIEYYFQNQLTGTMTYYYQ